MKKNMYLLLALTCVSLIGSTLLEFALSLHYLDRTHDSKMFTLILITTMVVGFAVNPLIGYIVDKFSKKYLVIIAEFISLLGLSIFYYHSQFLSTVIGIIILNCILAIADSISLVVFQSDMRALVGEKLLETYIIYNRIVTRIMLIVTPLLGGLIYSIINVKSILMIAFITEFLSLLIILFMKFTKLNVANQAIHQNKNSNFYNDFKEVFQFVRINKLLYLIFFTSFLINFLFSFITIGTQTSIVNIFHLSASNIGLIGTFVSLGSILTTLNMNKLKKKGYNQFFYLSIALMALIIIINLIPFFILSNYILVFIIIGSLIGGVATALFTIPNSIYKQLILPENIKGKYFSIENAFTFFSIPFGYAISGLLYSFSQKSYVIVYICLFITISIFLFSIRKVPFQQLYDQILLQKNSEK
ncbi:MFS transporter [Staphylococcus caprae]